MKQILLIGVGAGDPEQITVQAVNALNRVQVFFVLDKGPDAGDLLRWREEVCRRFITHSGYRWVQARDPQRDGDVPAGEQAYEHSVADWHEQRSLLLERLIAEHLGADETGGLLVWGDPGLYDGTLRIIDRILARGGERFEYQVIPGISSVQALAARHRIPLNRIGEPVRITTGRRLALCGLDEVENTVVMLDAHCTFERFLGQGLDIYWGAYLGTEDEILLAGRLDDLCERIKDRRHEARLRKGWIMDTYLLRKPL
jgi:precorrin-6A synthase